MRNQKLIGLPWKSAGNQGKICEKPKFCKKYAGNLSFLGILRESVGKNPNNGSICEKNYYGISSRCSTIFPWIKLWPASLGLHLCNLKPFETPPGGFKDRLKWQLFSSMLQFKSDGLNVNPSSNFTQWRIHSH